MALRRTPLLCLLLSFASLSSGDDLVLGGYRIRVDGFETVALRRPDGLGLTLATRGFRERDQHGNDVPGNAHRVRLADMTSQNVSVGEPCSRLIPNSNTEGRFVAVDALLDGDRQSVRLGYDVYYVTAHGALILNKELQRLYANNVIVALTLDGWKWCSPCDGDGGDGNSVTGAYLDVEMSVELPDGATVEEQDVKNGPREITLGNRMTLYLSNQVKVDGRWQAMPSGYPTLSPTPTPTRVNTYEMVVRLPRFDGRVTYEPVISLDDDDDVFRPSSNDTSRTACSRDDGGDPPHGSAPANQRASPPLAVSWLCAAVAMRSLC